MFQSTGKIRYSPRLLGQPATGDNWWIVVDTDPEIEQYYRKLFELSHFHCRKLQKPAWAGHITLCRNEEPPNKQFWHKYADLEISFSYVIPPKNNCVLTTGDLCYFWLTVECEQLLDIREELGLSREPEIPLHLTFGNSQKDSFLV